MAADQRGSHHAHDGQTCGRSESHDHPPVVAVDPSFIAVVLSTIAEVPTAGVVAGEAGLLVSSPQAARPTVPIAVIIATYLELFMCASAHVVEDGLPP